MSVKEIFELAIKNHQNNNLKAAENFYKKTLKIEPNHMGALNNLGLVFKGLGELEKASNHFKNVIEIDPNHTFALNNLGLVLQEVGKFEKALNYFKKVIEIDPSFKDAHFNYGNTFQKLNEYQKALNCYQKVIEIDPSYKQAFNNLGVAFQELGRYQEALNSYQKAIQIDPGYKDALNNIGGIFKKLGQYKKAMSFYEKLIKIDPNYKDALNNVGVVFHELDQYEKAMSFYEKAIKIDPNFTRAHFNRGVLLYERGKYENAMEVLKLINFKNSKSYLLSCLFKLDRPSVFQELLNKIIKIKEGNSIDAMIGSSCSRSKLRYGINISNPFCNDPLNYVLKRNLTKLCDFNDIFVKTIRNILDKNNIPLKNQGLLTNGIQTSGNFFNYEIEVTNKIKNIIHSEIENYKKNFANTDEGFLKKFPHRYTLNAWLVSMKSGGKLDAHMHENGWLSGSIYINVPKNIKGDSGNLVVCIEKDYEKDKNQNVKKSINVVTGNICLFPASLLHYTVPFESEEERIVLAFDVIAKN